MSKTIVKPTPSLEKILSGEELNFNDGLELMKDENLFLLGAAADKVRKELIGNNISFVSSYYLNYTNICVASCQLCAFYRREKDNDAYTLSPEQIVKRAEIAVNDMGATELHIVGGFNAKLGLEYYENMFKINKIKVSKNHYQSINPCRDIFYF